MKTDKNKKVSSKKDKVSSESSLEAGSNKIPGGFFANVNKKVLIYYGLGALVILLALKLIVSEFFINIIDFLISFLPMIVIVAMAAWGYFRQRDRREIILETLGLLLITLLFYILYSPDSWAPVLEALGSFGNLLELDNFFLLAAYFGVLYIAGTIIYIAYQRYALSSRPSVASGGIPSLVHKLIYRTFIVFFCLFAFSALAYPGAYSPITQFLADSFTSQPDTADQSGILAKLHKAITKTGSNLTDSITKSNSDLATTLEDTKTKLDESITQTNKDLKTNLETQLATGTFTVAGPLVVQNTSTTQDIIPESGSNYDLGTSSKNWNNLYVHSLHGASAVTIGASGSSHGVDASDDLVVSGDTEVKGTLYVDKALDLANNKAVNVASPTDDNDAANKTYVDNLIGAAAFIQRSGTTIYPTNSGDSLDMKTGNVDNVTTLSVGTVNGTNLNGTNLTVSDGTITGTLTAGTVSGTTGSFTNLSVSSSPGSNTAVANKLYVDNQILTKDTFLELADTPDSYSGKDGYYLKVDGSEVAFGQIPWGDILKTGSSLADLATRSAGDLSSGNLATGRMPAGGDWSLSSNLNIDSSTLYVDQGNNRVGIGTSSPGTTLEVNGAAKASGYVGAYLKPAADSTTALQLQTSTGTNVLNVDTTNGRVGIGTTGPTAKLHVVSAASATALLLDGSAAAGIGIARIIAPSNQSMQNVLGIEAPGDTFGRAAFGLDNGAPFFGFGTGSAQRDIFLSRSAANTFRISSDGGNGAGNLIINGNVGIGTTSPEAKLDVINTARVFNNVGANSIANLYVSVSKDGVGGAVPGTVNIGGIRSQYINSAWNSAKVSLLGPALLGYGNPLEYIDLSSDGTNKIISMSGNVGIGTTSPGAKLDVNGDILVEGTNKLSFNNNNEAIYSPVAGDMRIINRGTLQFYADTNNNDGDINEYLWHTGEADGGTSNIRMVIRNGGNVGIGTTDPQTLLHLQKSAGSAVELARFQNSGTAVESAAKITIGDTYGGTYRPSTISANYAGYGVRFNPSRDLAGFGFDFRNNANTASLLFIDSTGKVGIGTTTFGTNAAKVLAIGNGTAPTTSPADSVQLWAEDVAASSELRVRDELGNVTTLSPHNFSLLGGPSEDMAWSYYSERGNKIINVDMTKALRVVEDLSGESLIHIKNKDTGEDSARTIAVGRVDELNSRITALENQKSPAIRQGDLVESNLMVDSHLDLSTTNINTNNNKGVKPVETDDAVEARGIAPSSDGVKTPENSQDSYQEEKNNANSEVWAEFKDKIVTVLNEITFTARATFEKAVIFLADATFKGKVKFDNPVEIAGHPNGGEAGVAKIKKSDRKIEINFPNDFVAVPVVTATASGEAVVFQVKNESKGGFAIQLAEDAKDDLSFNWIAQEATGPVTESHGASKVQENSSGSSETPSETPSVEQKENTNTNGLDSPTKSENDNANDNLNKVNPPVNANQNTNSETDLNSNTNSNNQSTNLHSDNSNNNLSGQQAVDTPEIN